MDNLLVGIPEGFPGQLLHRLPREALLRMRSRPFTQDFAVTDLGFFPPSSGHRVTRNNGSQQWILIFVQTGGGWVQVAGERFDARAGQVILIPPKTPHSYGASPADPWSIFWIHFEGSGAKSLLSWSGFHHGVLVRNCRNSEELTVRFRAFLDLVEIGYPDQTLLALSAALVGILALLHEQPLQNHRNEAARRIDAAIQQMRDDVRKPRQLCEYARRCSLSVPQFSHLFRQHTGKSPMAFLNELRMLRAAHLLDVTQLSVKAVAGELGFEDACYFSRAFRKWTGLSPQNYRTR